MLNPGSSAQSGFEQFGPGELLQQFSFDRTVNEAELTDQNPNSEKGDKEFRYFLFDGFHCRRPTEHFQRRR